MIKSKKGGDTLPSELILVLTFVVVSTVIFIFLFGIVDATKEKITKTPEISYEFPALYVITFMEQELSNDEKKELGINEDSEFYVKDLLELTDDKAKEILNNKRDEYNLFYSTPDPLLGNNNVHYFYRLHSGQEYSESSLLDIYYNELPCKGNYQYFDFFREDYIFSVKTPDYEYNHVIFKTPGCRAFEGFNRARAG